MHETILVTGAAGFAGSHLLDLLEREPARLIPWRRPGDPLPPGRSGGELPWVSLDLLDRAEVADAIARTRPTVIYHCAGAASVGTAWDRTADALAVNALGTHHLLEAVRRAGLRPRVLIPGSALVYRASDRPIAETDPVRPANPYGLSKLAQEMLGARAAADGLPVFLTRSFNHIGPRQASSFFAASFARQIARIEAGVQEPVITVGNLAARRDLTDVRDTVRAYRAVVDRGRPGIIYNVCSGRAHEVGEILRQLVRLSTSAIDIRVDHGLLRPADTPLVVGDNRRVRAQTGWEPEIPLERTLADLLEYWRSEIARVV